MLLLLVVTACSALADKYSGAGRRGQPTASAGPRRPPRAYRAHTRPGYKLSVSRARRWIALVVVAGALTAPAAASAEAFFKAPGGDTFCQTDRGRLMCGLLSTRRADGSIPIYLLRASGAARVRPIVGDPDTEVPVLGYGQARRLLGGRVRCVSRRRGLRCASRVSGHGFVLSPRRRATF